jgi:hypothetical protein
MPCVQAIEGRAIKKKVTVGMDPPAVRGLWGIETHRGDREVAWAVPTEVHGTRLLRRPVPKGLL